MRVVIAGTSTNVGKTVFAAALVNAEGACDEPLPRGALAVEFPLGIPRVRVDVPVTHEQLRISSSTQNMIQNMKKCLGMIISILFRNQMIVFLKKLIILFISL